MDTMEGVVTIVQEGRFMLIDDLGAGHLFMLDPMAAAETEQLHPLQARQARVRVSYETPRNVIGLLARSISVA